VTDVLKAETRGKVRLLTLNRPDVRNAFNDALNEALANAVIDADADDGIAVTAITGAGSAFCSGDDLRKASIVLAGKRATRSRMNAYCRSVLGITSPLPLQGEPLVCLRNTPKHGLFNGAIYYVYRDLHEGDEKIGISTDAGDIEVQGRPISFEDPRAQRNNGIAAIYQELTIIPEMSALSNVFLGEVPHRWFIVDRGGMEKRFGELAQWMGVKIAPHAKANTLSVANQQMLEIMRAVMPSTT